MTGAGLLAILAAILGAIGYVLGLKRKASKERDARVRAELDRDQARGEAAVVKEQAKVDEAQAERSAGAREQSRAAATDPAVVNAPDPAAMVKAATDGLAKRQAERTPRQKATAAKIARGAKR